MAVFIHNGSPNLALPYITCNDTGSTLGILDQIVNDLGGTNGALPNSGVLPGPLVGQWQVWDDMRLFGQSKVTVSGTVTVTGAGNVSVTKRTTPGRGGTHPPTALPTPYSWNTYSPGYLSGNGGALAGDYMGWDFPPNAVATPLANFSGQVAKIVALPDNAGGGGKTTTSPAISGTAGYGTYFRVCRAIVLKCNSMVKPFYVYLQEGGNAALSLMVQVFETWDNTAHTGANGSALEWMRLYDSVGATNQTYQYSTGSAGRDIEAVKVQYVLSLQNDFLALWIGVDPSTVTYGNNGGAGDLVVVTNLNAVRPTDTSCTAFIPSCCFGSGRYLSAGASDLSAISAPMGLVQMLRSLAGGVWQSGYMPVPKSMPYLFDFYRSASDIDGAFEFCDMEVIQGSQSGVAPTATDLKRGDIPFIKMPMSLPTAHQQQFSYVKPDSSVELYMLIWLPAQPALPGGYPSGVNESDATTSSSYLNVARAGCNQGGFYYGTRGAGTVGNFTGAGILFRPKWVLLPIM